MYILVDAAPVVHAVIQIAALEILGRGMKLPPMNALRAFEAVSRCGSVSKAAEELCVSQGAVSQQLKNLEDHFGKELFNRSAQVFELNDAGKEFAHVVQQSLGQIAEASTNLTESTSALTLKISAPPSLTTKWLMPKLGAFYELRPDVSVILEESVELVTFNNDGFDAAIRFSDGIFDNLNSDHIITIGMHAVASPAYLEKHGYPEAIDNPLGHSLIDYFYSSKKISAQHIHWQDIVNGNLDDMAVEHQVYPDGLQSINAAIHGKGIALVPEYMSEEDIDSGRLISLSGRIHEYENRYYFVSPRDVRYNPALEAFREWLVETSKKHR